MILDGWSLVPGPKDVVPPFCSIELQEIAEYRPKQIADALLSISGVSLLNDASLSWRTWQARWENRGTGAFIDIGMTLFDTQPELWGGSELTGVCDPRDVLKLWLPLRALYPGVWLHDSRDTQIYTPDLFDREFARAPRR